MSATTRRGRMRPALAALLLAPALVACAAMMSRKQEAVQQAQAAYAQCEAKRVAHKLASHLAAVDCAIPTVTAAYREAAYPFDDLLTISIEARRIGAALVDAGVVSEATEQRDLATLAQRITAEENRRLEMMGFGGVPAPAVPAVLVQGLASFAAEPAEAAAPAPAPAPAPGSAANCFMLGGARHCN